MFLKIFVARVASKNQFVPLLCTRESEHATGESIYLHVSSSILNALCVMRSGDVCCCLCDVLQKYERKVSAELSVLSLASRAKSACSSSARSRK
jgi:hypothetical protein